MMVDPDLVASKLSELAGHLARVRARRKATADELGQDRDALDLVAFNLMLAVQTCADIASHHRRRRLGARCVPWRRFRAAPGRGSDLGASVRGAQSGGRAS